MQTAQRSPDLNKTEIGYGQLLTILMRRFIWFGGAIVGAVGIAIALGGIIQSRQVAETMSKRITDLSPGQGFTANMTTAFLVLVASNMGVPVSTTHVSCGSIFGIGIANRSGKWETISKILGTWVTTLPFAAMMSALVYLLFNADLS